MPVYRLFQHKELSTCSSHRADLLPLSVQFCLLIGLFEAPSLSAFRHLDAVLEGSPAGTNFIINPLYSTLWYAQINNHFVFELSACPGS